MVRTRPTTPASAQVALDEVYRLLVEIREDMISIKAADTSKRVEDHEERIRSLEKWIWRASGLAALGSAGLAEIVSRLLS